MTIRDLDETIHRSLKAGPKTAERIHELAGSDCSLYDVQAALRIWVRNGWARELGTGAYEFVKEPQ